MKLKVFTADGASSEEKEFAIPAFEGDKVSLLFVRLLSHTKRTSAKATRRQRHVPR